jgi:hypothetical protein
MSPSPPSTTSKRLGSRASALAHLVGHNPLVSAVVAGLTVALVAFFLGLSGDEEADAPRPKAGARSNDRLGGYPPRAPLDYGTCEAGTLTCGSATGPTFNSFGSVPSFGDQRYFVDARRSDQTAKGSFSDPLRDVSHGSREVVLRMYVNNDADPDTNSNGLGVARNTQVRFELPYVTGDALRAVGVVRADNARPIEVVDAVDLTSDEPFHLEFLRGSGKLYNDGRYKNGVARGDEITSAGVRIGCSSLDGSVPGGFGCQAIVQIRLRVVPSRRTVQQ